MGQKLLDPPSVDGWHTGEEWITSGALVDRVNFVSSHISNTNNPGVKKLLQKVGSSDAVSAYAVVEKCLDVLGPLDVTEDTREELITLAESALGEGGFSANGSIDVNLVLQLFKAITSSREFQRC